MEPPPDPKRNTEEDFSSRKKAKTLENTFSQILWKRNTPARTPMNVNLGYVTEDGRRASELYLGQYTEEERRAIPVHGPYTLYDLPTFLIYEAERQNHIRWCHFMYLRHLKRIAAQSNQPASNDQPPSNDQQPSNDR